MINLRLGGSVLLAVGAMSTSRILFNSGIGPSEQINIVRSGTAKVKLPDEHDWISFSVRLEMKDYSRYNLHFNVIDGPVAKSTKQLANPFVADKGLFRAGSGVLT
jgi:cellobiose dehydrogenase (acceptor)